MKFLSMSVLLAAALAAPCAIADVFDDTVSSAGLAVGANEECRAGDMGRALHDLAEMQIKTRAPSSAADRLNAELEQQIGIGHQQVRSGALSCEWVGTASNHAVTALHTLPFAADAAPPLEEAPAIVAAVESAGRLVGAGEECAQTDLFAGLRGLVAKQTQKSEQIRSAYESQVSAGHAAIIAKTLHCAGLRDRLNSVVTALHKLEPEPEYLRDDDAADAADERPRHSVSTSPTYMPDYDVKAYCRAVAGAGGSFSQMILGGCYKQEQQAYDAVKPVWVKLPSSVQQYCNEVASAGGNSSYMILEGCIKQEAGSARSNEDFEFHR